MKNPKVIYTILAISILLNAFLLGVIIFDKQQSSKEEVKEETAALSIDNIKEKAKHKIKDYVCSNLYFPDSYDPVEITVDSAFYSVLTDLDCLKAAEKLIDLRRDYHNAKFSYDEAVNNIRTFGGSGVFRHHTVERDNAMKTMEEVKPQILQCENTIKNRNTSNDGTFIGWFVYNRYRAKANNDMITFNEVFLLFDKEMENWNLRYELDKGREGNIEELKKIIEDVLSNEKSYVDR